MKIEMKMIMRRGKARQGKAESEQEKEIKIVIDLMCSSVLGVISLMIFAFIGAPPTQLSPACDG